MKITLIHGKDVEKGRLRYLNIVTALKKNNWEIIKINLEDKVSLIDKVSSSNSLFSDKTLYIIEKFNKVPVHEIEKLSQIQNDSNILFWQEGEGLQKNLKKLPKTTNIEKFDIPVLLFKFLDSFFPGNSINSISVLHELLKTEPIELVFALLARHVRDLYWALEVSDSLPYPSWRSQKLKSQAAKFGKLKLTKIIKLLVNADIESKTSQSLLSQSLDLLILKELK